MAALRVWKATQAGTAQGYVLLDEVIGRSDLITYAIGIGPDGALTPSRFCRTAKATARRFAMRRGGVSSPIVAICPNSNSAPTSRTSPAPHCHRSTSRKACAGCWRCGKPCCANRRLTLERASRPDHAGAFDARSDSDTACTWASAAVWLTGCVWLVLHLFSKRRTNSESRGIRSNPPCCGFTAY